MRSMQIRAASSKDLPAIRELFTEYANALEIDLCFQGFGEELAALPGKYAPPDGRLFLAFDNEQPVGCIALRRINGSICEMKRLYVRPAFRGRGLGRRLANETILAAREIGYERMRLDTLGSMLPAISIYEALGFQRIPAYYDNPNGSAVFMELALG